MPRLERLEDRIEPSIVTPFTPRFSVNAPGDIAIIGNTLETASTVNNAGRTAADVTAAQNGVAGPNGNHVNNNDWNMAYVDVDSDATTFNSSQATLTVPAGATVLFAGLYWGSVTTTSAQAAARNTVKFSTPASGGYVTLPGTSLGTSVIGSADFTGTPTGSIYQAFANVTSLVQAAGSGTYTVANVQAALRDANGNLPYMGSYAGWSLVVAYTVPGATERNLTVFDGFAEQQSTDSPLNIPISGFIAPPSGTVNAKIGVVSYEGDLGTTGDGMALNGTQLSDAATPANNFFNAGISNLGVPVTAKNPNYLNQMGFDAKIVQAPAGTIANGATSATITLSTSGDGYFPGVVTTAIDLYAPNLVDNKTVTDITSGGARSAVAAGDILQYTVSLTNNGLDAASNVVLTDPIPTNTHYVPGSLQIVSGANAGSKTDAFGDDQAEFNAAGNDVVFRLGTGANATSGGTLAIGASTTISFEVQVNLGTPANTVVTNQATTAFKGVTTGTSFSSLSNQASVSVLGLSTSPSPATVTLGPNPGPLTDTATLSGGSSPTGTITFTLFYNGGSTPVDTETVTVNGNGSYTTPNGFTLPGSGTAIGTYQWNATYGGDSKNSSVSDIGAANEQVTVNPANPAVVTGPTPSTVTLGTTSVTLKDTALLANGFRPTGTLTFALLGPGGSAVDTETVAVNGNGSYTTPNGFTLPTSGLAIGTYQWNATYGGDTNNSLASDISASNERVTVSAASPTIVTTASSAVTLPAGPPGTVTVSDSALFSGGYFPTGSIVFTLSGPGGFSYSQTDTVSGNGTYTASTTLPAAGQVSGTYTWTAHYAGDSNNAAAVDQGGVAEQTVVSQASPTLTTTPSPKTVTLGTSAVTLTDSATLANGYHPTGTITFTLVAPSGGTAATPTTKAPTTRVVRPSSP
jgi:large repetitive protein